MSESSMEYSPEATATATATVKGAASGSSRPGSATANIPEVMRNAPALCVSTTTSAPCASR